MGTRSKVPTCWWEQFARWPLQDRLQLLAVEELERVPRAYIAALWDAIDFTDASGKFSPHLTGSDGSEKVLELVVQPAVAADPMQHGTEAVRTSS
jgi:hypothetical protein